MLKKRVLILVFVLLLSSVLYLSSFQVRVSAYGTTSVQLVPTADSYVNSSSSGTNYGSESSMYVAATAEQCFAYLKFDLSTLPSGSNIVSANLSAYLSSTGGPIYMGETIGAYYCSDNSWLEAGITWNNKPSSDPTPTSTWSFPFIGFTGYKQWDVTTAVRTAAPAGALTIVLKFTSKTGDGHAVYVSREGGSKPNIWVEYSTAPALSGFDLQFAANTVKVTYPSDSSAKPLECAAAWVSDWMASAFVTTKLQNHNEGLDTNSNFVDQTTGRPQGDAGQGIISFGGPVVNPIVKYAESSGTASADRAPIRFHTEGDTFYFQHWDGSSIAGASLPASTINNDQDMFVIEVYLDARGRYVMLCYGFGWKGTYAAGKYFHTTIYPDLASYNFNWIVVKWQDTNGDGFVNNPGDGDTYTVIAPIL
jgi:hypothetical protein